VELIAQRTSRIDGVKKQIKTNDAMVDDVPWEFKLTKEYQNISRTMRTKVGEAVLQGAKVVLLDIVRTPKFSVEDLIMGIENAFRFHPEIEGVCIMLESRKFKLIDRTYFEDGRYVKTIKKWLE
jgi:hypothetical protein